MIEPIIKMSGFAWPPMAMAVAGKYSATEAHISQQRSRAYRSPFYVMLLLANRRHGPRAWGRSQWYSVTMGSMLAARSASTRRL